MQAFLDALISNPSKYILTLLLTGCVLALLVRASVTNIYDPWVFQQIFTVFASSVVIFMWYCGIVNSSLAIYHIAATFIFLVCAGFTFKRITRTQRVQRQIDRGALSFLRVVFLVLFVSSQLSAWALSGFSIFLESRLDAFSSGGGVGVFSRIISFTSILLIFLTVLRIGTAQSKKLNFLDLFVLLFSIAVAVLSGSKGSVFFILVYIMASNWICQRTFQDYAVPTVPKRKLILFGVVLSALMLIPAAVEQTRDTASDLGGPLQAVAFRMVSSGDIYMWMYGDDYLSFVSVSSPTALLFLDLLGMTRIVSWDQLPVHPGLQIFRDLFPNSDAIRGPNMRVDVFGLLYGNEWIGVIFCAALGSLFGILRAWLFRAKSALFFLPAVYIFFQAPMFFVDPVLGVTALVNTGFGIVIVMVAVAVIGSDPFGPGVLVMRSEKKNVDIQSPPKLPLC